MAPEENQFYSSSDLVTDGDVLNRMSAPSESSNIREDMNG